MASDSSSRVPLGSLALSHSSSSSLISNNASSMSTPPAFILRGHHAPIHSINLFNNEQLPLLLSGDANANIKLWNLKTRREIASLESLADSPQTSAILSLTRIPVRDQHDSMIIAAQFKGGIIKIIDLEHKESMVSLQCRSNAQVDSACLSFARLAMFPVSDDPFGSGDCFVIPGDEPSEVHVWSALGKKSGSAKNRSLLSFSLNYDHGRKTLGTCNAIKTVYDPLLGKSLILTGTEDGSISLWDPAYTRQPTSTVKLHNHPLIEFELIQDTLLSSEIAGVAGSSGKTISSFSINLRTNEIVKRKRLVQKLAGIGQFASASESSIVATGTWAHTVELFDWKTMKCLSHIEYHTGSVQAVSMNVISEGQWRALTIASGGTDKRIAVTICPQKAKNQKQKIEQKV